jgi:hypothetical protein
MTSASDGMIVRLRRYVRERTGDPAAAAGIGSRGAPILLLGAVGNGTFAALAMFLAGRALGLTAFEPLAQLWTMWGLVATALVFAFQQWEVARQGSYTTERRLRMPHGLTGTLGLVTAGTLLVTTVFRTDIFTSASLAWPLAAATLPFGTSLTGRSYALLAARQRFRSLAALSAGENGLRLLATVGLAAVDAPPVAFAVTVPIGFLVSILPLLLLRPSREATAAGTLRRGSLHIPLFATTGFSTNFLIFGGPLILGIAGGPPEVVSALFLALVPVRVPFLLVNSLLPAIAVATAALAGSGRLDLLRTWMRRGLALAAVLAVLGGAVGWWLGDLLVAVFLDGGGVVLPPTYATIFAAASICLVATATNVVAIALGRTRTVAATWLAVVASGFALAVIGTIASQIALGAWTLACALVVLVVHAGVGRRRAGTAA